VLIRKKEGIEVCFFTLLKVASEHSDKPKKRVQEHGSTKDTSLALFLEGQTVEAIAKERGLVQSTIESHLCSFIESGELAIERVLAVELQKEIAEGIAGAEEKTLKGIKTELGNAYSYGQIKIMLAYQRGLEAK